MGILGQECRDDKSGSGRDGMGNQVTMHIDDRILFLIIGAFIVLLAMFIVFLIKKIRNIIQSVIYIRVAGLLSPLLT